MKKATGDVLEPALAMQDHSWPAMNAKKTSFGANVSVGNCWPHAIRKKVDSMKARLKDADNKPILTQHVRQLHAITDEKAFSHAMMLFYEELHRMGETDFKNWFMREYDHEGLWLKWFAGKHDLLRNIQFYFKILTTLLPNCLRQAIRQLGFRLITRVWRGSSTRRRTMAPCA